MATYPTEDDDIIVGASGTKVISALGGNDQVPTRHNGVTIYGGTGEDYLSAVVEPHVVDEESVTSDIYGEEGDDNIFLSLGLLSENEMTGTINAKAYGGAGNDLIWADIQSDYAKLTGSFVGGAGDDDVRINFYSSGFWGTKAPEVVVDAGDGDDKVSVLAKVASDNVGESALVKAYGRSGADSINSTASAGSHSGASADNFLYGGAGNDSIKAIADAGSDIGGGPANWGEGGDGNDTIRLEARAVGNSIGGSNTAYGGDGKDSIYVGIDADDELAGVASGTNKVYGGSGNDTLSAKVLKLDGPEFDVSSRVYGGGGDDKLTVTGGVSNVLNGGSGNDTMTGGSGVDALTGGSGADKLKGAGGNDKFVFLWMAGGTAATRDTVLDFGSGSNAAGNDVLDLSAIDANVKASGNQTFKFGGTTKKTTGYVWVEESITSSGSYVKASNGGKELLVVSVLDGTSYDAGDWSASDFIL